MSFVFRPLLAVLIVLTAAPLAWSCCMVPATFAGSIGQDAQQAVMFYRDGREDLILGIDYRITPPPIAGKALASDPDDPPLLPDRFAWVITVPNEPDRYELADRELFAQVDRWAHDKVVPPRPIPRGVKADGKATPEAAPTGAIELGQREVIGPYDIQPVRGVGPDALSGLNDWLRDNGFPAEDPAHMKYFVDEGFTFLAIKISKPADADAVGDAGKLPPLHLSFETDAPYYPLRFSSRQGVFGVNLYVLSIEPVDYEKSLPSLDKMSWSRRDLLRNVSVKSDEFPELLAESFKDVKGGASIDDWYLNVVSARHVNRDNAIAKWDSDVFFTLNTDAPTNVNPAAPDRGSAGLFIGLPTAAVLAFIAAAIVLRRRRMAGG